MFKISGCVAVVLAGLFLLSSCVVPIVPTAAPTENLTPAVAQKNPWPRVNSFSVSNDNITPGQNVTLNWSTSDADTVYIDPQVGKVGASGSIEVSPQVTTKYTVTAAGAVGEATGWVTVQVAAKSTFMPDLVIASVSYNSGLLYYTIKNIGAVAAGQSYTYLYDQSKQQRDTSWVESLAPGAEKTLPFTNFNYDGNPITVCADGRQDVAEADEDNNCYVPIFGFKYNYDFTQYATRAIWRNTFGGVNFGEVGDNNSGMVTKINQIVAEDNVTYNNVIEMVPPGSSHQWIEGHFGDWQEQWNVGGSMVPLILPPSTHFTSWVGLSAAAEGGSGVTFIFGLQDAGGAVQWWPGLDVTYDGKLKPIDIDLSAYAGKQVMSILRVEAPAGPDKSYGLWIVPRLSQ
ncbi:MAG: CARDB domain-containing protein [Dehalococcoidia bacterium]